MRPFTFRTITALALAAVCIISAAAQDRYVWPVKLQKDYSKTYPVGSNTVSLQNRFGQLTIETWDKNEVKVEAHISVSAQTNEYATQIIDRININDELKGETISFVTKVGDNTDNNNRNGYNGGHEMKIDYIVHMPANAKLYAENNFGPITIGDYSGECELVDKYGTLTAGKLSNAKLLVVEFGKAVIESIHNSQMNFKYSRIDITKMTGNIKGQFEFCNSVDLAVDNTIQSLDLKNNYTSLYLVTPKDFSADYEIATNNARVTSKYLAFSEEKSNTMYAGNNYLSNHKYAGSLGKGGGTKINIRSSFGNIRFM